MSSEEDGDSEPVTDAATLLTAFTADTGYFSTSITHMESLLEDMFNVNRSPEGKMTPGAFKLGSPNPAPSLDDLIGGFSATKREDGSINLKHRPYNGIPLVIQKFDLDKATYDDLLLIGDDKFPLSSLFPDSPSIEKILRTILFSKACTSRVEKSCKGLVNKFLPNESCSNCVHQTADNDNIRGTKRKYEGTDLILCYRVSCYM